MDIDLAGDAITIGNGWHGLEQVGAERFRWADNDARFHVAQLLPSAADVSLVVEPGPGVELKAFELLVLNERGERVAACKVRGRETVSFELPAGPPCVHRLTLHIENGGKLARGDDRVLNFRVFKIGVVSQLPDIVAPDLGVRVGAGWHPLEKFNGAIFRWAGNQAVLQVPKPMSDAKICLDVESGPGMEFAPFDLAVADGSGRVLKTITIGKRQIIELPLEGGTSTLRLKAAREGRPTPGDARVMNYRAFSFMG